MRNHHRQAEQFSYTWVLDTPVCRISSEAFLAASVGSLISILLLSNMPLNHDCGACLGCARLLLRGGMPYVDYMNQQSLICDYLHAIPVAFASLVRAPIVDAFHVMVLGLTIYSACALALIVARPPVIMSLSARLFLMAAWISFSLLILKQQDYGQREYLFALAYVPFLYCREARYRGVTLSKVCSFVVGMIAGPFALMKPHFLLLVVAVEAWMLFRTRRIDTLRAPEWYALVLWGVGFAVHFLFLPSVLLEAIFQRWLPFIAAHYDTYNFPATHLLRILASPTHWIVPSPGIIPFVGLAASWMMRSQLRFQLEALSLAGLLSALIFFLLGRGWGYQLCPTIGFALMAIAMLAIAAVDLKVRSDELSHGQRSTFLRVAFCLACGLLVVATVYSAHKQFQDHEGQRWTDDFVSIIRGRSDRNDSVAFISSGILPAYPSLILADRLPGTRYTCCSVTIPYVYKGVTSSSFASFPYRFPNQWHLEERRFLEETALDIVKYRPRLIFVDATRPCQACPPGFCIDEYLNVIGWSRESLDNYRCLGNLHGFVVYYRKK